MANGRHRHAQKGRARMARVVAVVVLALLVPLAVVLAKATAAGVPLSCVTGSVYDVNQISPYMLTQVSTTTGASTLTATLNTPPVDSKGGQYLNALGIAPGGTAAYAVSDTPTTAGNISVQKYDPITGLVTTVGTIALPLGFAYTAVGGAVDPTTGLYWLQVYNASNGWYEFYAFNTATNTSLGRQFSFPWNTTNLALNGNGDIAFDATGRLYVLMSDGATRSQIRMFAPPLPTGNLTPTSGTLLASPVGNVTVQSNGIAFGADGYLYAQSLDGPGDQAQLRKFDPATGLAVGAPVPVFNPDGTPDYNGIDLGSCANPSTLTLQKNIVGRKVATDQFALSITGNGVSLNNTGVTSGSTTGLQTASGEVAGPVLAIPGKIYTITETGSSGANLANYTIAYQCVNTLAGNAVVASGTTSTGSITMPAVSASGANVVCTFTNTPLAPNINLVKTAGTVTGPDANGVYTATYTVTATNSGNAPGSYGPLLDSPAFDPNYTVQGASWTGQSAGSATGTGPFTLAPAGTVIGIGATQTYNVSITFKRGTGAVTACGGTGTGLFNSVSAVGESGPTTDNSACDTDLHTTVTLNKQVTDVNGNNPTPAAGWTLGASVTATAGTVTATPSSSTAVTGANGATAPWTLTFSGTSARATVAVSEVQQTGYAFKSGSCTVTPPAPGTPTTYTVTSAAPFSLTNIAPTSSVACTYINQPTAGTITWQKTDAASPTDYLSGSVWSLQGPGTTGATITVTDCTAAPCTGTRDTDARTGFLSVGGLAWGTYTLTETSAPAGYVLDTTARSVTIGATALTVNVGAIKNTQQRVPTIPLTGGIGADDYRIAGSVLAVLALILASLQYWRRRRRENTP